MTRNDITRRGFLSGLLAAASAPAIVRADALMRIMPLDSWAGWPTEGDFTIEAWMKKGEWQHHVVTRDSGRMRGYINGIEVLQYSNYAPTEAGVLLSLMPAIEARGNS